MTKMNLPCGGTAYFDYTTDTSYRCDSCMAVVGSMGQPRSCKEEAEKWDIVEKLGGTGWDYNIKVVE